MRCVSICTAGRFIAGSRCVCSSSRMSEASRPSSASEASPSPSPSPAPTPSATAPAASSPAPASATATVTATATAGSTPSPSKSSGGGSGSAGSAGDAEEEAALRREAEELRARIVSARQAVADVSFESATGDVLLLPKLRFRCARTYKGHLAKVYAIHWSRDSQHIVSCAQVRAPRRAATDWRRPLVKLECTTRTTRVQ